MCPSQTDLRYVIKLFTSIVRWVELSNGLPLTNQFWVIVNSHSLLITPSQGSTPAFRSKILSSAETNLALQIPEKYARQENCINDYAAEVRFVLTVDYSSLANPVLNSLTPSHHVESNYKCHWR